MSIAGLFYKKTFFIITQGKTKTSLKAGFSLNVSFSRFGDESSCQLELSGR